MTALPAMLVTNIQSDRFKRVLAGFGPEITGINSILAVCGGFRAENLTD